MTGRLLLRRTACYSLRSPSRFASRPYRVTPAWRGLAHQEDRVRRNTLECGNGEQLNTRHKTSMASSCCFSGAPEAAFSVELVIVSDLEREQGRQGHILH